MSKMHVKKGDKVVVLAGKDKGKKSQVVSVDPTAQRVVVDNVNILVHHNKPKSREDKGGIVRAAGAIDASNVQVICPSCNKATRIAHKKDEKGKSVRVCKKCGAVLDSKVKVSKEDKKAAKKAEAPNKTFKPAKTEKVENVEKVEEPKVAAPKKTATKTATKTASKTATSTTKKATKADK